MALPVRAPAHAGTFCSVVPTTLRKETSMSRFTRASHVIWHCQYHLVWVPKYRFRMLQGPIGKEVQKCVMVFCQQLGCEIVELNIQVDHVHLLLKVPPKLSISELMGVLKGRTAIRLFNEFPTLRKMSFPRKFVFQEVG